MLTCLRRAILLLPVLLGLTAFAPVGNDLKGVLVLGSGAAKDVKVSVEGRTAGNTLLFRVSVQIKKGDDHTAAAKKISDALNADMGFIASGLTASVKQGATPITSHVCFSPLTPGGSTKTSSKKTRGIAFGPL